MWQFVNKHTFNKHTVSIYKVPGIVTDSENSEVSQIRAHPCLPEVKSLQRKRGACKELREGKNHRFYYAVVSRA